MAGLFSMAVLLNMAGLWPLEHGVAECCTVLDQLAGSFVSTGAAALEAHVVTAHRGRWPLAASWGCARVTAVASCWQPTVALEQGPCTAAEQALPRGIVREREAARGESRGRRVTAQTSACGCG